MSDSFLVEEVESSGDLAHDLSGVVLGEVNILLNARQQGSTIDLLEHQIELLLVFEELNQLEDVGMSLTVVEGLDFAEYSSPSMARYLINNLYGTLYVGENIYTCLY